MSKVTIAGVEMVNMNGVVCGRSLQLVNEAGILEGPVKPSEGV